MTTDGWRCCVDFAGSGIELDEVVGGVFVKKRDAKASAAYEACRLLHQLGELDQYLLPGLRRGRKKRKKKRVEPAAVTGELFTIGRYDLHVPKVLRPAWSDEAEKVTFFAYKINVPRSDVPTDRTMGLLTTTRLPLHRVPPIVIYPNFAADPSLVFLKPCEQVCFTAEEVEQLETFHCQMFGFVIKLKQSEYVPSEKNFLIVPLVPAEEKEVLPPMSPDEVHDIIEKNSLSLNGKENTLKHAVEDIIDVMLPPDQGDPGEEGEVPDDFIIDWNLVKTCFNGHLSMPTLAETIGNDDVSISDLIVVTAYNGQLYVPQRIHTDASPKDKFIKPEYANYIEYYKARWKQDVHPDQPMIEASPFSPGARNVLRRSDHKQPRNVMMLIPQLCYVHRVSVSLARLWKNLTSILWRMETYFLVDQLRSYIGLKVDFDLLWAAITAGAAQENHNYERLEFLGDSVMKVQVSVFLFYTYPNEQEHFLTRQRTMYVANGSLCARARDRGFGGYLLSSAFRPKFWLPPGFDPDQLTDSDNLVKRELSLKMLADIVEGMIGAYYLSGGNHGVQQFLEWMDIPSELRLGKPMDAECVRYYKKGLSMVTDGDVKEDPDKKKIEDNRILLPEGVPRLGEEKVVEASDKNQTTTTEPQAAGTVPPNAESNSTQNAEDPLDQVMRLALWKCLREDDHGELMDLLAAHRKRLSVSMQHLLEQLELKMWPGGTGKFGSERVGLIAIAAGHDSEVPGTGAIDCLDALLELIDIRKASTQLQLALEGAKAMGRPEAVQLLETVLCRVALVEDASQVTNKRDDGVDTDQEYAKAEAIIATLADHSALPDSKPSSSPSAPLVSLEFESEMRKDLWSYLRTDNADKLVETLVDLAKQAGMSLADLLCQLELRMWTDGRQRGRFGLLAIAAANSTGLEKESTPALKCLAALLKLPHTQEQLAIALEAVKQCQTVSPVATDMLEKALEADTTTDFSAREFTSHTYVPAVTTPLLPIFPLPTCPNRRFRRFYHSIPKIEKKIRYTFKSRALLVEAFTHGSYAQATTPSYQRLEFLGDALVELLVTEVVFKLFTKATPGELTFHRQKLVGNRTFAQTVVRYKLHKYLFQHSAATLASITDYINDTAGARAQGRDPLSVDPPKVLGDIFESILGAVFVDSDRNMAAVQRVFEIIDFRILADTRQAQTGRSFRR